MFNRADADQLRQNLSGIEFLQSAVGSKSNLSDQATGLYTAYRRHYGLDFSDLEAGAGYHDVSCSIGTLASGSFELVCQQFLPSKSSPIKTAFILHGYFDHAGLYRHLIRHLLEKNVAVIILDLPGHGLSSGAPASINSFREYSEAFVGCLQEASKQGVAEPWVNIGQSTGAATIIDALLDKNLPQKFFFSTMCFSVLCYGLAIGRDQNIFLLSVDGFLLPPLVRFPTIAMTLNFFDSWNRLISYRAGNYLEIGYWR